MNKQKLTWEWWNWNELAVLAGKVNINNLSLLEITAQIKNSGFQQTHVQKGIDLMNGLSKAIRNGQLTGLDREIAIKLIKELEAVIPKHLWQHWW